MAVDSAVNSIASSSNNYSATSKGKTSSNDLDKEAFLNLKSHTTADGTINKDSESDDTKTDDTSKTDDKKTGTE